MSLFAFTVFTFAVLQLVLLLWAWIDIYNNQNLTTEQKVLFALVVLAIPVLGSIVYFLFKGNELRKREFLKD